MFLDFFKEKGHAVEPSAPLVPHDDPSLLWINSGVATLKKYFDGRVVPENPRITNAQKSIRTNDIENVGKTARHHTFFEMLGNFSIGEYFKVEAIEWAWEFLTDEKWIGFDPDKLSVTIHPEDEEAYEIWSKKVGIPEERIIRLEGNFWDIGEGPSGPNTEIFYDRGSEYGDDPSDPELYPGGENDRYLEVWNLVFSQFNHNPDGTYTPLPKKNIDTGMGLERMASVVQNVATNFDTDLFIPIIRAAEEISGLSYGVDKEQDVAFKVIADHIRTVAFAIGDGAIPSNEGRGYVLRRLLRRAVRYAKQIGISRPFMYELVTVVGEIMVDFYPEVKENREFIEKVIKNEEERFHETLHEGLAILFDVIKIEKKKGSSQIQGSDVFRLYDTYGFPIELTEEYAEEEGMSVDHDGFEIEMDQQRERARTARQDVDSMQVQSGVLGDIKNESTFVGYDQLQIPANVIVLLKDGQLVDEASQGEEIQFMLDQTPFYAESGGQIADRGVIFADTVKVAIKDVKKAPNGQHLHRAVVTEGSLEVNTKVTAIVDEINRGKVIKNHTATHLLQKALKEVLGEHVKQAGSLVEPDRLRFDFSHYAAVTPDELERIEALANGEVLSNDPVRSYETTKAEAESMGAIAFFGDKYGEVVRVLEAGKHSLELCGGTHVRATGDIGTIKIVSEGSIGSNLRRIEAVTGTNSVKLLQRDERELARAAQLLGTSADTVVDGIEKRLEEIRSLRDELKLVRAKAATGRAAELAASATDGVVVARVDGLP